MFGIRFGKTGANRQHEKKVSIADEKKHVIDSMLHQSGRVELTEKNRDFYYEYFANHPDQFCSYEDLRKAGTSMSKEKLKEEGLRSNLRISAEFFRTLNNDGRTDPIRSAEIIVLSISTGLSTLRDLQSCKDADVDRVRFCASNMASGPCDAAKDLDGKKIPLGEAEVMPFASCSRPDQCACIYQAKL